MRVRLSALEGVETLTIAGTTHGEVNFRREGSMVRVVGGALAASFEVSAATSTGLVIGERRYPGKLRIEIDGQRGLRAENYVDLEDYIAGVVPGELILWSANEAEIEAQAIAARTYALRSLATRHVFRKNAFLWDDTRDQVYVGRFRMEDSASTRKILERLERGLRRSRGRILVDADGDVYDVRFHASCGGHNTSPAEAFPLESSLSHAVVACQPCREIAAQERTWSKEDTRRRRVHWRWTASEPELAKLARSLSLGSRLTGLATPQADAYGRWQSVELIGDRARTRISIERLRGELGAADLKSGLVLTTWPEVGSPLRGGLYVEGIGRGHGAGLCQVGSHEYAVRGWDAATILGHYLPGSRLVHIDDFNASLAVVSNLL